MDLDELWEAYSINRDEAAREKLILNYLPLVKQLVGRLAVRLPSGIGYEDLEGYGVIGLIESVQKFNPAKGVSFETFAYRRIRGAMIDEVRKQYWVPRTLWQKLQTVNAEKERLRKIHGDSVSDEQVAASMNITIAELNKISNYYNQLSVNSLDEVLTSSDGDSVRWGNLIPDPNSPDPLDVIEEQDGYRILAEAVNSLAEKDRLVMGLYYQDNLTLKEIGLVLEVSESRVCQLHARAMSRLREKIKEML